jgi:two-component system CheB/CheR fusion protein
VIRPREAATRSAAPDERDHRIAQLERELEDRRDHVDALMEAYDSADEVLRSASEETLTANEELRNINEELQMAKEQVQSANEELETLNEELQDRNRELSYVADDLLNVLDSLNLAIVLVAGDLTIRRFTPSAERVLNLIPSDVGRPLGDLRTNLETEDLSRVVRGVIETLGPVDRTVQDTEGRAYALRVRPYRTRDSKVGGAVVILMERDAAKPA